jgi:hypothetical protein
VIESDNDADLVARARIGDDDAFCHLALRHPGAPAVRNHDRPDPPPP